MQYTPKNNGFNIQISQYNNSQNHETPDIGDAIGDPRKHRRPLYPIADKTKIWSKDELSLLERCPFRPVITAYNAPRFVFDYHSAGGQLGQFRLGLILPNGTSKWLQDWEYIEVNYVDGQLSWYLRDPEFAGITITMNATAGVTFCGLIHQISIDGIKNPATLIAVYGGANANYQDFIEDEEEYKYKPEYCDKNTISYERSNFILTRDFDNNDKVWNEKWFAGKLIKNWKAVIKGGTTFSARNGTAIAPAEDASPADILAETDFKSKEKDGAAAVMEVLVSPREKDGYFVIGMGDGVDQALYKPRQTMNDTLEENEFTADRIVVLTPNPHLDSAMRMMAFNNEGAWGGNVFVHGAWSWRHGYIGWRNLYGPIIYGQIEQVKRSIQNILDLCYQQNGENKGSLSDRIEEVSNHFNMNEVFIEQVRYYLDYTDDKEIKKQFFPILEGIVEWENRRLKPTEEPLYENSKNNWRGDSLWNINGQCVQASANMYNAYTLLAELASELGADPAVYNNKAEELRAAIQDKLWQKRKGVFANSIDTRGEKQLHPEPELADIYQSAELGLADPLQLYQMTHWAEKNLNQSETANNGKIYWNSNWFNPGSYTHTHNANDLAYADELNFALTNFQAGQSDTAYAIIKAALCGIFNGPTPGGLSCQMDSEGLQLANDEYTDAVSMFSRTVVEGLFGICKKQRTNSVELTPNFPSEWDEASIVTPAFTYRWRRANENITIEWRSPDAVELTLRIPVNADEIQLARVDDELAEFEIEPGVGFTWVKLNVKSANHGVISISYKPSTAVIPEPVTIKAGTALKLELPDANEIYDPQGLLIKPTLKNGKLSGKASGEPGWGVLFAKRGGEECPSWLPISINIEPDVETAPQIWNEPKYMKADKTKFEMYDLKKYYNADSITQAIQMVANTIDEPEKSYSKAGWDSRKEHYINRCVNQPNPPSDKAWRAKINDSDIGWTTDGIPFKSPQVGQNIVVFSKEGKVRESVKITIGRKCRKLFIMLGCLTFPNQSCVTNLRVTLKYADKSKVDIDLVNPTTIADTWSSWYGSYFDCPANGFENIGGRFGPAGTIEVKDRTQPVEVDTTAQIIPIETNNASELKSVELTAIANDAIFGLMGITVLK